MSYEDEERRRRERRPRFFDNPYTQMRYEQDPDAFERQERIEEERAEKKRKEWEEQMKHVREQEKYWPYRSREEWENARAIAAMRRRMELGEGGELRESRIRERRAEIPESELKESKEREFKENELREAREKQERLERQSERMSAATLCKAIESPEGCIKIILTDRGVVKPHIEAHVVGADKIESVKGWLSRRGLSPRMEERHDGLHLNFDPEEALKVAPELKDLSKKENVVWRDFFVRSQGLDNELRDADVLRYLSDKGFDKNEIDKLLRKEAEGEDVQPEKLETKENFNSCIIEKWEKFKGKKSINEMARELKIPHETLRQRLIALGLHEPNTLPSSDRQVLRFHGERPKIPSEMMEEVACLAFGMLADYAGTVIEKGRYNLGVCAGESREFAEKFAKIANKSFSVSYIKPGLDKDEWLVRFGYKPLWEWYHEYFTFGKYGWEIKPKTMGWLKQRESEELGRILSWFFEGDGGVNTVKKCVYATSVNKRGLEQIQELIEMLGIKANLGGPYEPESGDQSKYYRLYISNKEGIEKFTKLIGFVTEEKRRNLEKLITLIYKK